MQPHAIMLRITAYTAARLTTWLALRNAQTNIGRRLRLGFEPGRQCPIRLTEGISLIRAKSVEKNRIR
jgi:hypothetical protein